ncbi:hypothetical protein [Actinophytocola sp.]|uniref:hypothetical protein n=1 Tax=Actinophytocola sp. TaxID=1872138 RepID=UPI002D800687|nr:hypothetical protein [Actinophytocola sp.]HET9142963.1 hypothetical protein [Actinophytocola sp.]
MLLGDVKGLDVAKLSGRGLPRAFPAPNLTPTVAERLHTLSHSSNRDPLADVAEHVVAATDESCGASAAVTAWPSPMYRTPAARLDPLGDHGVGVDAVRNLIPDEQAVPGEKDDRNVSHSRGRTGDLIGTMSWRHRPRTQRFISVESAGSGPKDAPHDADHLWHDGRVLFALG